MKPDSPNPFRSTALPSPEDDSEALEELLKEWVQEDIAIDAMLEDDEAQGCPYALQ